MLKYIAAAFFFLIGTVEIVLALSGNLRETVMKNSIVRSKRTEPLFLFLAGLSAFVMGLSILFYNLFW
ncbi:MAG: hypothetical protein LC754_08020 [Acidobacteria bacterium]|nr:hypothetical protein [Acidobacteriota bacterium]